MTAHQTNELPRLRPPALNLHVLALIVFVLAAVGMGLVFRFASMQEQRELMHWQNKLGLIADSRASAIDTWLEGYFKELGDVAENPSLQLYLAELLNPTTPKLAAAEEPAEAVFLRNLLSLTADRLGVIEKSSEEMKSINANVRQPSGTGIVIVGNDGKILVSTAGLPELDAALAQKIADVPKGKAALLDMFVAPSGAMRIGFVVPIYPIQHEALPAEQIGKLIAVKNVDASLFTLLQHPGVTEKTLEAVLLRKDADNVVYLSPVKNSQPLVTKLSLHTPQLDAAYAIAATDNFAVKLNAEARPALMTSRAIERAPWVMMVHIDRDQALAESDVWRRQTELIMVLSLLAVLGGIIAVWYYGTSRRTLMLSLETARMAKRIAAQEKMLRVVTDNQLEPILIVDAENKAHFANARAAQNLHLTVSDIMGKELSSLMGAAQAQDYNDYNKSALIGETRLTREWQTENETGKHVFQTEHIPLSHVPVDALPYPSPGVLIIDQDITEIVGERERRARILQQLINTLVSIVDKRDPYAANHSARVAVVARETARDMGLDRNLVDTAEIAGKLMNIGKIVVPRELLTKNTTLAEREIKFVRESLQSSADLLRGIDFNGPVVTTLHQAQERFDGTGPLGLKGDAILVTARIVAVSNAFIGMISPRSYREAMATDQAVKVLLQNIDTWFDHRVVVALANFAENGRGKDILWQMSYPIK